MAIYHTQQESKVYELITPVLEFMGYDAIRIRFKQGESNTLQIMIGRRDGNPVLLQDCEAASRRLSVILDVAEFMDMKYALELSSPGLERPLTRPQDFVAHIGAVVKITTFAPIEGARKFTAKLLASEEGEISVRPVDNNSVIRMRLDNIREAILQPFAEEKMGKKQHKQGQRKKLNKLGGKRQ